MSTNTNYTSSTEKTRGPRPDRDAHPAEHVWWLICKDRFRYGCIGSERVLEPGTVLPFLKVIDIASEGLIGRFATGREIRSEREHMNLQYNESLLFLRAGGPKPGTSWMSPEESDIVFRGSTVMMKKWILDHAKIDLERAKDLTLGGIKHRFGSGNGFAISTLNEATVDWCAFELHFRAQVSTNIRHLAHFRKPEVIRQLVDLGANFYSCNSKKGDARCMVIFFAFSRPVAVDLLQNLSLLVRESYDLGIERVASSYEADEYDLPCVAGPVSGSIFDPLTGAQKPDSAWSRVRLVNPDHLVLLEFLPGQSRLMGYSETKTFCKLIGLSDKWQWGLRDPFGAKPDRVFTITPGKLYGEQETFVGDPFTHIVYHHALRAGQQVFATTRTEEAARWLAVDIDVDLIGSGEKAERYEVDWNDLNVYINPTVIQRFAEQQVHPHLRLSGRGFYVEYFFEAPVLKSKLQDLARITLGLFNAEHVEVVSPTKAKAYLQGGIMLKQDVDSTRQLIRLPGCVHHATGKVSCYEDGSFLPAQFSKADRLEELVAFFKAETPSLYTPYTSLLSSFQKKGPESEPDREKSIISQDSMQLKYEGVGKGLDLADAEQQELVARLLDYLKGERGFKRGPRPDEIPHLAALEMLVERASKSECAFRCATRDLQQRITKMANKPEKSRERAAKAIRALRDAGLILLDREPVIRGTKIQGVEMRPRSTWYRPNMGLLRKIYEKLPE